MKPIFRFKKSAMSSRTLRKLYGNRSEDVKEEKKVVGDCQEEEEEEEEGEIADVELNVVNKFSLLVILLKVLIVKKN